MTLLQIIQQVCYELGLTAPAAVVSATDTQTLQLYNLAQREGQELLKVHDWTFLQQLFIINVAEPISVTGDTTSGSAVITGMSSTTGIVANTFVCTGNAIPTSARVVSVDSSSQVTLDSEATGDGTASALVFSQDTYNLPTTLDRHIDATQWDRTNRWPLLGPSSPQEDEWHRSGVVTVGPRRHFRQIGIPPTAFRYWPPPGTQDSFPMEFAHEYISSGWVNVNGGSATYANVFANDDDVPLFSPQAMIMGVKWRFWQIKQFDYAPLQAEYRDYVDQLIAMDGPKGTLSLARRRFNPLVTPANVQDGYFPAGVNTVNG